MLLPGVLLVASGAAFGALAVLPASAEPGPTMTASAALAPVALAPAALATVEVAPPANVALMGALTKGLAEANKPPPPPPAPARASRDRAPAPAAPAAAPEFARPSDGALTSVYGRRWGRLHAGIDLAAGTGSPIRAAAGGTVSAAGTESGYGRAVRIVHPDGTMTVYGHMSQLLVSTGQRVAAGEQIGREGSTGRSTGPHLHFEVRVDGTPVDPLAWLRARGVDV